jgi:hypothetical protein
MSPAARAEHFRIECNRAWERAAMFQREAGQLKERLDRAEVTIEALADALVAKKTKSDIPF